MGTPLDKERWREFLRLLPEYGDRGGLRRLSERLNVRYGTAKRWKAEAEKHPRAWREEALAKLAGYRRQMDPLRDDFERRLAKIDDDWTKRRKPKPEL
ncbi:hypothetical protein RB623_24280 [Mesorhizobium sp. LHD-90]|uniref:hypothetical protein n=1 Tax=Mesorhizobium sp. LHD-90 TaxID=3071414 RepID=UPI0027E1962D|nr:hypothetical protein [Mesorhizobium sp. LHD-90]MDQ6437183.1 hypothetical protein [Mesorhizobium sp. LHD-90]